jgi:hypothetical protein
MTCRSRGIAAVAGRRAQDRHRQSLCERDQEPDQPRAGPGGRGGLQDALLDTRSDARWRQHAWKLRRQGRQPPEQWRRPAAILSIWQRRRQLGLGISPRQRDHGWLFALCRHDSGSRCRRARRHCRIAQPDLRQCCSWCAGSLPTCVIKPPVPFVRLVSSGVAPPSFLRSFTLSRRALPPLRWRRSRAPPPKGSSVSARVPNPEHLANQSAFAPRIVQFSDTEPAPTYWETATPFMYHIAMLPPVVSRQRMSLLPSPLKSPV